MNSWELSLGLVPIPPAWYAVRNKKIKEKAVRLFNNEEIIAIRCAISKAIKKYNLRKANVKLVFSELEAMELDNILYTPSTLQMIRQITVATIKELANGVTDELILKLFDSGNTVDQIVKKTLVTKSSVRRRLLLYGRVLNEHTAYMSSSEEFSREELLKIRLIIRDTIIKTGMQRADTAVINKVLHAEGIASLEKLNVLHNIIRPRIVSILKNIKAGIADEDILDMFDSGKRVADIVSKTGLSSRGVNGILALYGRK